MPTSDSHLSESERVLNFWLPSWPEFLFYFVISSVVFAILNAQTLWQFFNIRALGADLSVSGDYSPITAPLFNFLNAHDTPILLALWGAIGCLVFAIVLGVQSILKTYRQEVAESQYKIGGISVNPNYWHNAVRLDVTFGSLVLGWALYLVLYLNGIVTWVSHQFFTGLNAHWTGSYTILIALLVNTLAFYLLIKLTQILLSTWYLIRPTA